MADVFSFVVDNVHFAHIVDPKFADDYVSDKSGHFAPGVVVAGLFKLQMGRAKRYDLQILASEFTRHGKLLIKRPIF